MLEAMGRVPRELFVPEQERRRAYADAALPIGHGQTISQPYMVARIAEALTLRPGERVLDVGTGSGYQAAVLAELGANVVTIERIPSSRSRRGRTSPPPATTSTSGSATARSASPSSRRSTRSRSPQPRPRSRRRSTSSSRPRGRLVVPVGGQRAQRARADRAQPRGPGGRPFGAVPLCAAPRRGGLPRLTASGTLARRWPSPPQLPAPAPARRCATRTTGCSWPSSPWSASAAT